MVEISIHVSWHRPEDWPPFFYPLHKLGDFRPTYRPDLGVPQPTGISLGKDALAERMRRYATERNMPHSDKKGWEFTYGLAVEKESPMSGATRLLEADLDHSPECLVVSPPPPSKHPEIEDSPRPHRPLVGLQIVGRGPIGPRPEILDRHFRRLFSHSKFDEIASRGSPVVFRDLRAHHLRL